MSAEKIAKNHVGTLPRYTCIHTHRVTHSHVHAQDTTQLLLPDRGIMPADTHGHRKAFLKYTNIPTRSGHTRTYRHIQTLDRL